MKKVSIVLLTIFALFMLSSCESLGFGSSLKDIFNVKSWNWNIVERLDDEGSKVAEKTEKIITPVQEPVVVVKEEIPQVVTEKIVEPVKNEVVEVVEEVKNDTTDIIKEISERFDVKEEVKEEVKEIAQKVEQEVKQDVEKVADKTEQVVEEATISLETAVADVLNSIKEKETPKATNPVIVVPAKETTGQKEAEKASEPVEPKTAAEIISDSSPAEPVEEIGSSAVLIIILVAAGLIGIAIAYYCISIKRKSY